MKHHALLFLVAMAVMVYACAYETCIIDGKTIKKGQTYLPPGECQKVTCEGSNSISALGCPAEHPSSPICILIPQDNYKTYPECCPRYKC